MPRQPNVKSRVGLDLCLVHSGETEVLDPGGRS